MRPTQHFLSHIVLHGIILLILGVLPWGCASVEPGEETSGKVRSVESPDGAKITLFFHLKDTNIPDLLLSIPEIEVLQGAAWLPLITDVLNINTREIGQQQILVARRSLPKGSYQKIRIAFDDASLMEKGKQLPLGITKKHSEFILPSPISLGQGDSETLFMTLDVKSSLGVKGSLDPVIYFRSSETNPLSEDLAYVTCPDINTIYLIRTDRNWVSGSIGVTGRPKNVFIDPDEKKLYVLASDEALIKVFDITTSQQIYSIRIPLTVNPNSMDISPDFQWGYVLDGRGDYLVKLDLKSGQLASRVRIGENPQYIYYVSQMEILAVTSKFSQFVQLVNAGSLATFATIPLGSSLQGLLYKDNLLFIAESAANSVTIYDMKSNEIVKRINVGSSPRRLERHGEYIFVTNYDGASVSVFLSDQLSASNEVMTGNKPLEMAVSSKRNRLYVGDEQPGGITVIDLTSIRKVNYIELGSRVEDIAVVQ
ncbi:YncE family protein [Thermodesulfobacteriota bacterium]